jgi:hypothetical protein
MLVPRDGKDPYEIALKKYCNNVAILDPTLKRHCKEDFQSFLFGCPPGPKDILSLEEALWGDKDKEFSDAIKSSTSAGYPMKYQAVNLKKILFHPKNPRDVTNPGFQEMKTIVDTLISDANKGIRHLIIYTDNMKNERRDEAKVVSGSTRLYNGCTFDYLTAFRMLFGSFIQWIHKNSIRNGMVTAINPFSTQWDSLTHHLRSTGTGKDPLVCDGDFSHYDGDMLTEFAFEILDIINEWYDDEYTQARKIFWLEITNSRHLFNNIVFEWYGSLPSGNPITLIINCMNNQLIHRYAFYLDIPTTVVFHKVVKLFVTGDDIAMGVIDEYKDRFNGVVIKSLMERIGYTYTSADKLSKMVPFKKLSEISFLKRGFRFEPLLARYVAPLDIKTVKEIPLWTKKHDSLAITESNIEEFFDELCLHDDDTWNKYANDYQNAIQVLYPEFSEQSRIMETRILRLSRKMNEELIPFTAKQAKRMRVPSG